MTSWRFVPRGTQTTGILLCTAPTASIGQVRLLSSIVILRQNVSAVEIRESIVFHSLQCVLKESRQADGNLCVVLQGSLFPVQKFQPGL